MTGTQLSSAARRSKAAAPERTKGEAVTPVATLRLIDKVGVTAAHRLLGISTTTLHKARKPDAVVSRVIELASEAELRKLQEEGSAAATVVSPRAVASADGRRLVIMEVPEHRADQLEQIARAWGAEFTKA